MNINYPFVFRNLATNAGRFMSKLPFQTCQLSLLPEEIRNVGYWLNIGKAQRKIASRFGPGSSRAENTEQLAQSQRNSGFERFVKSRWLALSGKACGSEKLGKPRCG
jgi:hypothetical protein